MTAFELQFISNPVSGTIYWYKVICARLTYDVIRYSKMLPLGGAMETTRNHKAVQGVTGVPDVDVPEQRVVHYYKVIRMGLHLSPLTSHAAHTLVLCPIFASQEEVRGHVLQPGSRNDCCNIFLAVSTLWCRQVGIKVPIH